MKLNAEYLQNRRMLRRTGLAIERNTLRAEHESAWIVACAVGLALAAICLAASCQHVMQGAA